MGLRAEGSLHLNQRELLVSVAAAAGVLLHLRAIAGRAVRVIQAEAALQIDEVIHAAADRDGFPLLIGIARGSRVQLDQVAVGGGAACVIPCEGGGVTIEDVVVAAGRSVPELPVPAVLIALAAVLLERRAVRGAPVDIRQAKSADRADDVVPVAGVEGATPAATATTTAAATAPTGAP